MSDIIAGQNENSEPYTISTHNGHTVARQHNLRNIKVVSKEEHITINGHHETWLDIKPSEAYQKIFGEAVADYNATQVSKGHAERQIKNYYRKVQDDKQKHALYEMVVGIGSYEHHPDNATSRQILREFCKSWKQRNPHLVMIGAYYHADEIGANHVHITYIPVATGLSRGMSRQNALVKALNQMGYETHGIHDTAQIQWEKAQNAELERLCNEHGLEITHPEIEHQKHLDTDEYRQRKRIEELEKKNADLEVKNTELELWIRHQRSAAEQERREAKSLYIQTQQFAQRTLERSGSTGDMELGLSCREEHTR